MTQTPSRREQRREVRRQQILDAALVVFSEKGYQAANVSDVAAAAGVSQGTIYWYFDSKEDLLTSALLSHFGSFGEQTISALDEYMSASEKLRAMAAIMAGLAEGVEGLFSLFLGYWQSTSKRDDASALWKALLETYKDIGVQIIEAGVQSGEFAPVDVESVVWALMAAYDGLAAYQMLMPDLDIDHISERFADVVVCGLRAQRGLRVD